ncbi:glycine cleavage system protein R [Thioalkalivibrio sp.]|uniref:glycine cleavage system protein R n=1 Tax=Thioalkalivibrio sp. TaxID=2093813 RepID=UPI00397516E2
MKTSLILTLLGPDRPGLVSVVAARAKLAGANWMESRMAQLAGQFAGVVRLEVDSEAADHLEAVLRALEGEGLHVTVERGRDTPAPVRHRVQMELVGHDHPGIVQDIAAVLAGHGVTIDMLETECEPAPMSGGLLFRARAELGMPTEMGLDGLQDDLEAIANELMVDLELHDAERAGG